MRKFIFAASLVSFLTSVFLCSCERVDIMRDEPSADSPLVTLDDVARILSAAGMDAEQLNEVYDAVSGSVDNGYDSEYTLRDLLLTPGAAVGDNRLTKSAKGSSRAYSNPLRNVFYDHFLSNSVTKGGDSGPDSEVQAGKCLDYLRDSDMQIYWHCPDNWDGETMPVIAVEPASDTPVITGYSMLPDGTLEKVLVTEEMAAVTPVWVINHNDDAMFQTLEVYRKNHPEWGEGGQIVINPVSRASSQVRTLVLKDFTMKRNYDEWYRGASEFFIKFGSVESFTAATEAEMQLYNPSVTDFMVVVRRSQVGKAQPLNTVLVSEWTTQLEKIAFMITEDDGGTVTTWNCSAVVKYNSKSYGFEIKIPYNSKDDIVWRGQLSRKYIEANNDITGYFGDVVLTFAIQ